MDEFQPFQDNKRKIYGVYLSLANLSFEDENNLPNTTMPVESSFGKVGTIWCGSDFSCSNIAGSHAVFTIPGVIDAKMEKDLGEDQWRRLRVAALDGSSKFDFGGG